MNDNQRHHGRLRELNVIAGGNRTRASHTENEQDAPAKIQYNNTPREEYTEYSQDFEDFEQYGDYGDYEEYEDYEDFEDYEEVKRPRNHSSSPQKSKQSNTKRKSTKRQNPQLSSKRQSSTRQSSARQNSTRQSSGKKRRTTKSKKSFRKDILAWILLGLQAVLSIGTIVILSILNVLPLKFFIPVILILVILWIVVLFMQLRRAGKLPLAGKILSILLCILLVVGNYYLIITNKAIDTVTEETVYNNTYLDVIVLADDPAETIEDARDYTFGIQATYQPLNLNKAIDEIENDLGKTIATKDYESVMNQVSALYSHEVKAMIYNRNFKSTIASVRENFEEEVKVIKTITLKDAISIKSDSSVNVTSEPFIFYISGNDEYGDLIVEGGRSDVNILVAVNPVSREILMITTPRDFYVVFPYITNGTRDKLTHAGVYGTQCQLDTLNELYDINIDYYCKVNFSSLIDIVNAVGGVDVYNEMEFEFDESDGLIIPEGWVHLDGYTALCFCRERHSFEDGDAARARHQQAVIEAIINKLLSSTGFSAYSQLIKTLERCCVTNMPKESISALVKKQLAEGGSWNITKVAAEGEGMLQTTYSMGNMGLYVTMPYAKSIQNIKTMLNQLYSGQPVTALMMNEEYDDYSLVDEPGPVPETSEEDEDGYTIVRSDLVDANGKVFGTEVRHIDELENNKLIKVEYLDLNGNPMTASEVESRRSGNETEKDSEDETTTEEGTSEDETEPDEDTDENTGDADEEGDEAVEGNDSNEDDAGADNNDGSGEEDDDEV